MPSTQETTLAAVADKPVAAHDAAPESASDDGVLRVFICYKRSSTGLPPKEVEQFHAALEERLFWRNPAYQIFRDKGPDPSDRINAGDNYRRVIEEKLKGSVCCIIILVPAIFFSRECEIEVEIFKERVERNKGFFLPVEFVTVADGAEASSEQYGRIATAMQFNTIAETLKHIDRVDFTKLWSVDPDSQAYKDAVDDIALAIDRQVKQLQGLSTGTRRVAREAPSRRRHGAVIAAAAVLLIGAVGALTPPARNAIVSTASLIFARTGTRAISWVGYEGELVVAAPTSVFSAVDSGPTGKLAPGVLQAGKGNVTAISQATADGEDWYQVVRNGQSTLLKAVDVPQWRAFDGLLHFPPLTPFYLSAEEDARSAGYLQPGDVQATQNTIAGLLRGTGRYRDWFRISRGDGSVQYVRASDAPTWERWDKPLDLVLPTPAYQDGDDVPDEELGPGLLSVSVSGIRAVLIGEAKQGGWYRIARDFAPTLYVKKQSVPDWTPLPDGTDLMQPVDVRDGPNLKLASHQFGPGRFFTDPRKADVSGVTWFRFSTQTGDVFFPADGNAGKLAAWRSVKGCLWGVANGTAYADPFKSASSGSVMKDVAVSRGRPVQSGAFAGESWFRYQTSGSGDALLEYRYIQASLVELQPC